MSAPATEWRTQLSPSLDAVEKFCAEFRLWRKGVCPDLAPFPVELLLREALTNSVVHGCPKMPDQYISCVLRAKLGRLLILVSDQGEGFDWRAAWDHKADLFEDHGRGVEIFRRYANSVRFNPKGNSITLIKRFSTGTTI